MRLIDADEMKRDVEAQYELLEFFRKDADMEEIAQIVFTGMIAEINKMPTIDPVKRGRWLAVKLLDDEADFGEVDGAQCSECGGAYDSGYWAKTYFEYCPYCGAKMDDEE